MSGATVRPSGIPYRTVSERLFGVYLNRRRLPYEYERPVGAKCPDFFVEHPTAGSVVVEVHEFAYAPPPRVGSFDPYAHVRAAINEKRAQGKGAKGKHPYILVLYSHGWPVLDVNGVTGAMFGDVAVQMWIDPSTGGAVGDSSAIFGHGGKMMHRGSKAPRVQNTTFSAVVVLCMFNPTRVRLDRGFASIPDGLDRGEHVSRLVEVEEELTRRGVYRREFEIPRLIVCHNPDASVPLPLDAFGGPHDEQWAMSREGGHLHLAATGLGYHEVPT